MQGFKVEKRKTSLLKVSFTMCRLNENGRINLCVYRFTSDIIVVI